MISYCVTVYKEAKEVKNLLPLLHGSLQYKDELVILQTYRETKEQDENWYKQISTLCSNYATNYSTFHFCNNFAEMKNYMSSLASKDNKYIFNFDADEAMDKNMIAAIRYFLEHQEAAKTFDILYIPRMNIVNGLTEEDIKQWSWSLNDRGWINWPDYQPRIYRNTGNIKWSGNVHEHLTGYQSQGFIEPDGQIYITHIKDIDKQRKQNEFYDTL